MDYRHFELRDLLCEALIALDAKDHAAVDRLLTKALRWVEADWLATPTVLRPLDASAAALPDDADDD